MGISEEIRTEVINWWFSEEGRMTKERAVIVNKTIELSLKEVEEIFNEVVEEHKTYIEERKMEFISVKLLKEKFRLKQQEDKD